MEDFPNEGILQFFLSDFDYDGGFGLYSAKTDCLDGGLDQGVSGFVGITNFPASCG